MTGRNREAIVALLGVTARRRCTPRSIRSFRRRGWSGCAKRAGSSSPCRCRVRRARPRGLRRACLDLSTLPLAGSGMSLPAPGGRDAAYMIFTSGTSGQPKGVVVEHASALNLSQALARTVYANVVGEGLRVTVNAPFSFDSSIKQILQLLSGHCLVLVPQEVRSDPQRMLGFLEERRIDVLDCTPSLFRLLLQAGLDDAHPALPGRILVGASASTKRPGRSPRLAPLPGVQSLRSYRSHGERQPGAGRRACAADHRPRPGQRRSACGRWPRSSQDPWRQRRTVDRRRRVARGYAGDAGEAAGRFLEEGWPGSGRLYRSGDRCAGAPTVAWSSSGGSTNR
uniref:Surfactin synthase subunit 1 n=1 Tax=Pseudomonas aeruginosa TaxID=287 RepID=A0A5E5QSX0_PSEAI|nr:Surfactin synthase subunit 1 [Pseudomonas aeruginosa]